MNVDLRTYVVSKDGPWAEGSAPGFTAQRLHLTSPGDAVSLTGPLRIRVTVQERDLLRTYANSPVPSYHDVYSYELDIPVGHKWDQFLGTPQAELQRVEEAASSAPVPAALVINSNQGVGGGGGLRINTNLNQLTQRAILIEPATRAQAPAVMHKDDLPCDFAVTNVPDTGAFFPSTCEPCNGGQVALPPACGPTVDIPVAKGGAVRPRFFTGMFISREDLETQLRYVRLKNRLQNRASGQGVVWGLGLALQGRKVVVAPGYAVDCCGNDLTVTTPYAVDTAALLGDPTICQKVKQRMHLLLEYVECPEEPRPVHGDACAPQASQCEMSRVRESVRLRLVEPRDYEARGPIDAFLEEWAQFKKEFKLPWVEDSKDEAPTMSPFVPFQVHVKLDNQLAGTLSPGINAPAQQDFSRARVVELTIEAKPGWTLVGGDVVQERAELWQAATPLPIARAPFTWALVWKSTPLNGGTDNSAARESSIQFRFKNWKAIPLDPSVGNGQLSGDLWLDLKQGPRTQEDTAQDKPLNVTARVSTVSVEPLELAPWPCLEEPCAEGTGARRFPVLPPFIHDDPQAPGTPAAPRVLLLAVVWSWLAMEMSHHKYGTDSAVYTTRLRVAILLYWLIAYGLFGAGTEAEQARLNTAVRKLMQAWCGALLYPGPECTGTPHGVVVGCATVKGGQIVDVDPWGGRRWVVHYPLVAHWGEQLGFVAPDVTASRLFSLLCCLGDLNVGQVPGLVGQLKLLQLPRNKQQASQVGAQTQQASVLEQEVFQTASVPTGAGILSIGDADALVRKLGELGVKTGSGTSLGMMDFASRLVTTLRMPTPPADVPLERFTLDALPALTLFMPAAQKAPTSEAVAGQPPPVPAPATQTLSRLQEAVRAPVAAARAKARVSRTLTSVLETMSSDVLRETPVSQVTEEASLAKKLTGAGLRTVADVLEQDPEALHERLGIPAEKVDALYDASEKLVGKVTRAVTEAAAQPGSDKALGSRKELQSESVRKRFREALSQQLTSAKLQVPAERLDAAVARVVKKG